MYYKLKKIKGLSSLFYIYPLSGRAVVISIIIRHTNIVMDTVFEPILRMDSIPWLTIIINNLQFIVSNTFWTEDNDRSVIFILHLSLSGISILISIITKDTNMIKNTVLENFLRKDSISELKFEKKNCQSIGSNKYWPEDTHMSVVLVSYLLH